jgi:hypothetical protein
MYIPPPSIFGGNAQFEEYNGRYQLQYKNFSRYDKYTNQYYHFNQFVLSLNGNV